MNKILLLPIVTFLLTSCTTKQKEQTKGFDYEDVVNLTIDWEAIMSVESKDYYAYIYSPICGHCNEIKQEVICYSLIHYGTLYFVEYSSDIPIINDKEALIDKDKVEDLGIVGTPSMFRIINHVVKENIVGSKEIIKTLTKS